ncbi:MAG: M28 family peptidase [Phycisphaerales bacterium]
MPIIHAGFTLASLCCCGTLAIATTTAAWPPMDSDAGNGHSTAILNDANIIIGPLSAHAFQRQTPDDAGAELDAAEINLPVLFAALGPDATQWYQHVMTLSNSFFEGRAPGTAGNRHAADYIEYYFRTFGLEPAFPEAVAGSDDAAAADDTDAETPPSNGEDVASAWTTYRQPFNAFNREEMATDNVGGVLRGRGQLADQWIIIGGHYDHVGYGRPGRRAADSPVHPGADDNASGTAGVLILAEKFAKAYEDAGDDANLRSILFMAFSAEEMGLLGSRHYVRNSTLNAEDIHLMINLDMIGRLRGDTLMVQGVETARGLLDRIHPHLQESELTIYADPTGQGPSDHASFYGGGIPVLFFFTGTHDVYHRPGDFGYTVNPHGAARILKLVWNVAFDEASDPDRLRFTR